MTIDPSTLAPVYTRHTSWRMRTVAEQELLYQRASKTVRHWAPEKNGVLQSETYLTYLQEGGEGGSGAARGGQQKGAAHRPHTPADPKGSADFSLYFIDISILLPIIPAQADRSEGF